MRRMTKATAIPASVKVIVWARDGHKCVLCGSPKGSPVSHVIRRSQGGLGVEENIVTLCPECHRAFDEGPYRRSIYERITDYLKHFYPDWTKESVIYKKGDRYGK